MAISATGLKLSSAPTPYMALESAKQKVAELVNGLLQESSPGKEALISYISQPQDSKFGNLTLPVFRFVPKGQKPPAFAETLSNQLNLSTDVLRFEAIGPYINVFLDENQMNKDVLAQACIAPSIPKKDSPLVMVEFVSPNTNKPLHLGHVRNMALGESISRLLEHEGMRVLRVQIINDRGAHICKSMLAYQKFGRNETPQTEKMKGDHFVGKYYHLFNEKYESDSKLEEEAQFLLQRWEQNDPAVRELWEKMNAWWYEGVQQSFAYFGIAFDKNYYESLLFDKGKDIAHHAYSQGKFVKLDNGAIAAPLKSFNLPDKVVLRSDGTTMYITQDIYLAQKRFEEYPNLSKIIYIVGSEQELHFQQTFAILQLIGMPQAKQCYHLSYGLVTRPSGGKVSSRSGEVIIADDIMRETYELALEELNKRNPDLADKIKEHRAKVIGLSAVKFFMLKQDAHKTIEFDPKESLSFEGQTGPYVLYTLARTYSLLRKATVKPNMGLGNLLATGKEKELIHLLAKKSDIFSNTTAHYSPHILVQYLLELANAFNSYYHETPIIQEDKNAESARMALVQSINCVLEEGLFVLNIETLKEM